MINQGMLPWDYYQSAYADSAHSAQLQAAMDRYRAVQMRAALLNEQTAQLLPLRMSLLRSRAASAASRAPGGVNPAPLGAPAADPAATAADFSTTGLPSPDDANPAPPPATEAAAAPQPNASLDGALAWLKSNPSDPRAPAIRKALGLPSPSTAASSAPDAPTNAADGP